MIGLENQGLLEKGMAEAQINNASNYLPTWFEKPETEKDGETEDREMKYFLKAEETMRLREREFGAM